jgi:hypothetical protein
LAVPDREQINAENHVHKHVVDTAVPREPPAARAQERQDGFAAANK